MTPRLRLYPPDRWPVCCPEHARALVAYYASRGSQAVVRGCYVLVWRS